VLLQLVVRESLDVHDCVPFGQAGVPGRVVGHGRPER
jgi:hypothetical protein